MEAKSAATTTNNNSYGIKGEWTGDSDTGGSFSLDKSSGNLLLIKSTSKGSPFNIMFKNNTSNPYDDDEDYDNDKSNNDRNNNNKARTNNKYFEVCIKKLNGNISVGVVKNTNEFLPGYKCSGMFYNGNVTNGSAALITNFGPYLKVNDTIGVLTIQNSNKIRTVFYLNNRCLGAAFEITTTTTTTTNEDIYNPCLHVTGEATVVYKVPPTIPINTGNREEEEMDNGNAYLGMWKVEKIFAGPELGEYRLPSNRDILFTFVKTGNNNNITNDTSSLLQLSVKVGNTIRCDVNITDKKDSDNGFDLIEVGKSKGGGIISTQMLPPPELQKVEELIIKSLPILYKMIITTQQNEEKEKEGEQQRTPTKQQQSLIMTGSTAEFIAHRYTKTFPPLTKY